MLSSNRINVYMSIYCTGAIWGQPTWGTWWAWDASININVGSYVFLRITYNKL